MKNVKAEIGKESMKPTEIIYRNKERRGDIPIRQKGISVKAVGLQEVIKRLKNIWKFQKLD